jgi:osmotically-inducible protein OsmY
MPENTEILNTVRAALMSQPLVGLSTHPIALRYDDGTLTLEGEVASVAAKKLALEAAAAVPGVTGIIDRVRVTPAQPMGDGAIRDELRRAFLQEPAFADFAIRETAKGRTESVSEPTRCDGMIEYEVADGIVTLNGQVPGLGQKRLAGVLAWWVPGSRDVVNGIEEAPEEEDNDAEMTDAVRLALEKDVFVDAGQIRVTTLDRVVTLEGLVTSEAEKDMAEQDAWCVFGVDRVVNRLAVRP